MTNSSPESVHWVLDEGRTGVVSVIVPTYNRANLVTRALNSVFAQTYRPIELVVVDDGSTDGTAEVLELWAARHRGEDFAIHLVCQPNQGAQVARNRGLLECTGEYIQFLDSDDRILEKKLSLQVNCLRNSGADYCYSRTERLAEDGSIQETFGIRKCDGMAWIADHIWHTSSPLFLRSVCSEVGPWDVSMHGCQEYEYAARVKAAHFKEFFLDEILDQAITHGGPSISGQDSARYAQSMELAAQRILALLPQRSEQSILERHHVAKNMIAVALRYARYGDAASARRCMKSAVALEPHKVRYLMAVVYALSDIIPPLWLLETIRSTKRIGRVAHSVFTNINRD